MKKAIAKDTFSIGQMVNKGREFHIRKGSMGRVKLCNEPSNSTSVGEFGPEFMKKHFEIIEG